jgi:hemolysin activation/secretion protein
MKMTGIILAGCAAFIALGSAASAQQAMTGTVTRIDRIDGTIAIQLQTTPAQTSAQSGTVGANTGGAAEEVKTRVQGNLLNTLHAGDRVKFSLTETDGTRTISNVERQ